MVQDECVPFENFLVERTVPFHFPVEQWCISLRSMVIVHQVGAAYPGFSSMKQLGVFLLLLGWDASPSQG